MKTLSKIVLLLIFELFYQLNNALHKLLEFSKLVHLNGELCTLILWGEQKKASRIFGTKCFQ